MSGKKKVYLSHSNLADPVVSTLLRQEIAKYDVEVLEYERQDNSDKIDSCDVLLIVPPRQDSTTNQFTVGRGQYETLCTYANSHYAASRKVYVVAFANRGRGLVIRSAYGWSRTGDNWTRGYGAMYVERPLLLLTDLNLPVMTALKPTETGELKELRLNGEMIQPVSLTTEPVFTSEHFAKVMEVANKVLPYTAHFLRDALNSEIGVKVRDDSPTLEKTRVSSVRMVREFDYGALYAKSETKKEYKASLALVGKTLKLVA